MRIVEFGKYFDPYFGGIEQVTAVSAQALAADHAVAVLCHSHERGPRRLERRGRCRIVREATEAVIFKQPISLAMMFRLRSLRPDLIHFHAPNFWGAAVIALTCPNTPLLITHHADVEGRRTVRALLMPLYRRLARRALTVIVSSEKTAAHSRDLPQNLPRVDVIPLGVDEAKFFPQALAQSPAVRETLFGFVGRFVWYKGLAVLLSAFAKIQQPARLLLIGDGPLRQEIERECDRLGIRDRVTFAGTVDEPTKIALLQSIDVLVFPSTHITETFGLAQVEAQILGKPVIATTLPTGASDIVAHEETGLMVPCADVEALSMAMAKLAAAPDLRQRMGEAGRMRALARFTHRAYAAALRRVVREVAATTRRPQ